MILTPALIGAATHGKLVDPTKIGHFKQRKRRIAKGGVKQTDSLGLRADVKKTLPALWFSSFLQQIDFFTTLVKTYNHITE